MKAPIEQSSYNFLVLIYYDMCARTDVISIPKYLIGIAIVITGDKRARNRQVGCVRSERLCDNTNSSVMPNFVSLLNHFSVQYNIKYAATNDYDFIMLM